MVAPTEKFKILLCRGVHCTSAKTSGSSKPLHYEHNNNSRQKVKNQYKSVKYKHLLRSPLYDTIYISGGDRPLRQ